MKKGLLLALLAGSIIPAAKAQEQAPVRRHCGIHQVYEYKAANIPGYAEHIAAQRAALSKMAQEVKAMRAAGKSTNANDTIPVVFHIIVDATQLAQMGGINGVQQRADSQIAVINRDFNAMNSDSSSIPTVWKPLYGNIGIHFGLAHTDANGNATPGYEIISTGSIQTTDTTGFAADNSGDYTTQKYTSAHVANSWDVTKYLNVWVINFLPSSDGLLGLTTPPSFTGSSWGASPTSEMGVSLNFEAFGVRVPGNTYFVQGITKGRTLTHELGHFFEIWHTWGDDGGLCPNTGGQDDGIADTPPETDANYGTPTFPLYDNCSPTGTSNGVMFMNYMDYVDDASMYMFTNDQAAVMQSSVGSETSSLTTHPTLLHYPTTTAIGNVTAGSEFNVFPNPSHGTVSVSFSVAPAQLQSIHVYNMVGQQVANTIAVTGNSNYSFDLSGYSKGIYLVQCTFATGNVTKKIVLQ